MLSIELPTLLALFGTALMAVVIFAPAAPHASVTTSFAPPLVPALEPWALPLEPLPAEPFEPAPPPAPDPPPAPAWPASIDPSAAGCDAASRLELVGALAEVRTPWSYATLQRALGEEADALVRSALLRALDAS